MPTAFYIIFLAVAYDIYILKQLILIHILTDIWENSLYFALDCFYIAFFYDGANSKNGRGNELL